MGRWQPRASDDQPKNEGQFAEEHYGDDRADPGEDAWKEEAHKEACQVAETGDPLQDAQYFREKAGFENQHPEGQEPDWPQKMLAIRPPGVYLCPGKSSPGLVCAGVNAFR